MVLGITMLNCPQEGNFHHPLLHILQFLSSSTTISSWTLLPGHQPSLEARFPWGENLGSNLDQTLYTRLKLFHFVLYCPPVLRYPELWTLFWSSIQQLTGDMMLHCVPSRLQIWLTFAPGLCVSPATGKKKKKSYSIHAHTAARDLQSTVSKWRAKTWAFFFFHSALL